MRAAVLHAPGDIRIEQRPKPIVAPGSALLRVAAVGVCGSDIPRLLTKGAHKMPLICGHEFSGVIEAIEFASESDANSNLRVGDLVTVAPLIPCRSCSQCLIGEFSRCRQYNYFGSRCDGAYAEYLSVPIGNVLRAPAGVKPTMLAMADPASIALHALWRAGGLTAGHQGAVIGCGPIGLFAIQWMKLMGASNICAVDIDASKLELARAAGANRVCLSSDLPQPDFSAELVIEAVGKAASINAAIAMTKPGGNLAVIGIPTEDITLDNRSYQHLLRQEIALRGAWNSFGAPFPGPQWHTTLEKMAQGELQGDFMISHQLDLGELPAFFARIAAGNMDFCKVIFQP